MPDSAILDKLRKLQVLKERASNEHEAATASLRIQEILEKHNLDIGVLKLQEEKGSELSAGPKRKRIPDHYPILAHAVDELIDVRFFIQGSNSGGWEYVFIGLKANVEAAVLTFCYLIDSVESLLDAWKREPDSLLSRFWRECGKKDYRAFRIGASERIYRFILDEKHKQSPHSTEVILVGTALAQRMLDAMNFEAVKRTDFRVNSAEAQSYRDGYERGKQINPREAHSSRKIRGKRSDDRH